MKNIIISTIVLLPLGCKTSSREDFGSRTSDISMKIPDDLTAYESKASFSRIDSSADPKVVRGSEIKVKIPAGIYKVDLVLSDKSGAEVYRSCDPQKTYSFLNSKEDAIIEICRSSDRALIGKTLSTSIIVQPPPIVEPPPVIPLPPVGGGGGTGPEVPVVVTPPGTEPTVDDTPLFIEDRTCFGLPASYSRSGNEIVIKMTGSIKDHLFDLTNAPRCTLLMNITKNGGQGFSPVHYKMTFEADAETMKQNYYISSLVKDENGLQALPCRSMLLNSDLNSGAAYQCSFYDTTPEKLHNILERNKIPYANSCAAESKQIKFDFYLNGAVDKRLKEMKITELRVQIPLAEACITPTN